MSSVFPCALAAQSKVQQAEWGLAASLYSLNLLASWQTWHFEGIPSFKLQSILHHWLCITWFANFKVSIFVILSLYHYVYHSLEEWCNSLPKLNI